MAVLKCKMCGGDLFFEEGASTCVCDYCGNTNTLPVIASDQEMNLFNRANHFRMINEFDRAIAAYEKILDMDDTNAEAHWGIVLSRYGIEYVEDPVSHERIPTCHRMQMTNILSDPDYLAAVKHADFLASSEYKAQAERIAEIQKGILAISSQEKPYDVFICYKETDENGSRTVDSTLAQEIYYGLTESGYRVFFSRITLEDKLGQEYEPYIFAALNSAKVMVVVGTKPEHFNTVWVKNEWSRYLDLMKKDQKRLLIPCYRDMDPYDLPDELSMLQSQDMSKIGFMQDLLRGIKKVLGSDAKKQVNQVLATVQQGTMGTSALVQVKRGNMALEDQDWKKADDFFEEALNHDPECAEAYLGKLLSQEMKKSWDELVSVWVSKYENWTAEQLEARSSDIAHIKKISREYTIPGYLEGYSIQRLYTFDFGYDSALSCRKQQKERQLKELSNERHLQRAKKYAKGQTKARIEEGLGEVSKKLDQRIADAQQKDAASVEKIKKKYEAFLEETDIKVSNLNKDAQERREQDYLDAVGKMKAATDVSSYEVTISKLRTVGGYKDSQNLILECQKEIDRLNEEKRREEECQAEARRQQIAREKKKKKTIAKILIGLLAACVAGFFFVNKVIIPENDYKAAVALMESGDYRAAYEAFDKLDGYQDSSKLMTSITKTLLKESNVGDSVLLGSYEQDNDESDGKEKIEWIILDQKEDQVLLISKYLLDTKKYNTEQRKITWQECSIREWLNDAFLNEAFTSDEIEIIMRTTVRAENNEKNNTMAGNDTEDKVLLLSISEAEKYFSSNGERSCKPTAYSKAQGSDGWWWLRSTGDVGNHASIISSYGELSSWGYYVDISIGGVRPALWVNLES